MDLLVVSTQKIFYQCDDGCARALIEAFPEAFARVERSKPAPASPVIQPRWAIGRIGSNDGPSLTLNKVSGEVVTYPGPQCYYPSAEEAQRAFTACGNPIPADVLEKFAALLERAKPIDPDVVNDARLRAEYKQYSREQGERDAQRLIEGPR